MALSAAFSACSRAPAEPGEPAKSSEASEPLVKPLQWQPPPAWTLAAEGQRSGPQKAIYKVPTVGADKEEAQLHVLFYGTGSEGDPEKRLNEWFGEFDGNAGAQAKREAFEVRGFKVEMVEAAGTFKIAMGPKVGPKKKAAMQMVKENFRLIGAVVKTKEQGNWFFKLVGPDETVQAARPAFRALLDSIQ